MSENINKAILLAAGFGTRLKPLTLTTPKPLLPINGTVLIDHQLKYLAKHGVTDIAINLHHLGEKIRKHVGNGLRHGVRVHYSDEPVILGTGGGVKQAASLLKEGPLIIFNCDALIDVDLTKVIKSHLENRAAVTMVVMELKAGLKYNPLMVDRDHFIVEFGRGKHFYSSLHIINRNVLDILPPAGTPACLIEDGYKKLLANGQKIKAFVHEGYFNDLGTPENYEMAKHDIASGKLLVL